MAAFIVAAPYLSSALKYGESLVSGESSNTGYTGPTTEYGTSTAQCSSSVSIMSLAAPDIGSNGSASVSSPSNYCDLAAYALQLINEDRATVGAAPVVLGYNQAAQQHADSMLYYGYFSHFDTQGYKPYMRYTLLGGRGADFENIAFYSSSAGPYTSTSAEEQTIKNLEYSMMYHDNDSIGCYCNNGHRVNILNTLHNVVSIGVAFNSGNLYFDEEFENEYLNLSVAATPRTASNPYYVTMEGTIAHSVKSPDAIYIAYDPAPSAETPGQLSSMPHEYTPGTLLGGVLPPGFLGGCGRFSSGTTVCADMWQFGSGVVGIAFSLSPFVRGSGPGAYTVYLVTGTDTNSAITTVSLFVS